EEKEAARAAMEAAHERYKRMKAGARPEEIRQARCELESAQADLRLAREKWERSNYLVRKTAAPSEEYEIAQATYNRLQSMVNQAQAALDLLLAGNRAEDIAEAAALWQQAQANHQLMMAGTRAEDIAAAEARVAEARGKLREVEANLQEAVVRSPERAVVEVV